ncbi:MAG: beta-xylosidase [Anaerohalosphaeraceae bacterium]
MAHKQIHRISVLLLVTLWPALYSSFCCGQSDPVSIHINLTKKIGPMPPVWAWFGHDEPNYTYMKDGRKLLSELAALSPYPVYIRTHNLMTSGDGTAALKWGSTNIYTEDEKGNPIYDWTIIDKLFDTWVSRGMKPLVEIGFMPEALSSKPQPYRHHWQPGMPYKDIFTGWAYPPKDYNKWAQLVYQWVSHSVQRYGKDEVASWYWELWNEPDSGYWQGTAEEYFKLYDYTADAVNRALPTARIGGPHSTGPGGQRAAQFLRQFLKHCAEGTNAVTGKTGAPLDFIGFHAKGSPRVVDGAVQMDMGRQLRDISKGFEIVASFEPFKSLPIIIGESDPEGCAACSMQDYPENAYRNGTMYSSYTAASFARKYALADHFGVNFLGAVSWSFEFEDQPWFNGYRDLATNGVDKPVLNVFRMYGLMRGDRVEVSGDLAYDCLTVRDVSVRGDKPDINALAAADKDGTAVMVWNYHDNDISAPASPVEVTIEGVPAAQALLYHYRIDKEHSNSYEVWKKMGNPQKPTAEQIETLEKAGQLQLLSSPEWIKIKQGQAIIPMFLPRQGVSLLKLDWQR